jgi:hypothetical protein
MHLSPAEYSFTGQGLYVLEGVQHREKSMGDLNVVRVPVLVSHTHLAVKCELKKPSIIVLLALALESKVVPIFVLSK